MINQTQIVGKKYDVGNRIIYNTKILKSDIFDYNDAYILVRGDITIYSTCCNSNSIQT